MPHEKKYFSSLSNSVKEQGLKVGRNIADWICNAQSPWAEASAAPGVIPFSVDHLNVEIAAPSWNYAYAFMGLAGAYKALGDERYKAVALRLGTVLKSFQILDPFHKEHYGAIREMSPLCPWCFTRDAISGGWGLVEMYRFTKEEEYLERAKLFGQWVLRKGLDEEGYPWFGVQLEPKFYPHTGAHIENDIQGNFQGGGLNFFYQMYKVTGDKEWCKPMTAIADIFVDHVQQDSGYFVSIYRATKKPVASSDAYAMLHRGNDDLGTLGLLGMYDITTNKKYLASVKKFLDAVWAAQRQDGFFEDSVAASAIILNATYEARELVEIEGLTDEKIERAIKAMLSAQTIYDHPRVRGALREQCNSQYSMVTMRANCYALILLMKLFAGVNEYLCD